MMQLLLIGLGAGAATALLFASVASGTALSVMLFYLAPLPILIAGIGWSHIAAMFAAIVGAGALAAVFGWDLFLTFLIGIGLPAWWLSYLALLARPAASPTAPDGLEWYPPGHLVFWAALISAAIVMIGILSLATDLESFRTAMRSGIERALRHGPGNGSSPPETPLVRKAIEIMVAYMPLAAGLLTTLTSLINIALAGQIVKLSGRLRRPWPDLSQMRLPVYAAPITLAATVGYFVGGMPGILSGVLMISLLAAYTVVGFAVLHAITRGLNGRPIIIAGVYVTSIGLVWPSVAMLLLGIADAAFDLRGRAQRRGPPPPRT